MNENNRESSHQKFVGARLALARGFRGLTLDEVANEVASSFGLISHYENGRKEPSEDVVLALAEALGVLATFFYQPLEEPWQEEECSFRHRKSTPEKIKKLARAHGTMVSLVVRHLATVLRFPTYNVPCHKAKTAEEIEAAAMKCRVKWELGSDTPILHMGRVLENAGVILVQHFQYAEKIDAFCRRGNADAIVILNTARNSTSRSIFDLAHECGHLVLHANTETGSDETEDAADYFAGALLLPQKAFSREFLAAPFSWPHVFALKRRWRVSAAAIVKRAYQLKLISALKYRQAYKALSSNGWLKKEPYEPEFVGPELLPAAFKAIEQGLGMSVASVSDALHVTPAMFHQLTGISVERPRRKSVLSFDKSTA